MEAVRRCSSPRSSSSSSSSSSCCRRWFLLLLLVVVVVVLFLGEPATCAAPATSGEEYSLGKDCPSLDACRGGVPNLDCCTAINDAVNKGECSCVCKQLKRYNHGNLGRDCIAMWCIRCGSCRCATASNGAVHLLEFQI